MNAPDLPLCRLGKQVCIWGVMVPSGNLLAQPGKGQPGLSPAPRRRHIGPAWWTRAARAASRRCAQPPPPPALCASLGPWIPAGGTARGPGPSWTPGPSLAPAWRFQKAPDAFNLVQASKIWAKPAPRLPTSPPGLCVPSMSALQSAPPLVSQVAGANAAYRQKTPLSPKEKHCHTHKVRPVPRVTYGGEGRGRIGLCKLGQSPAPDARHFSASVFIFPLRRHSRKLAHHLSFVLTNPHNTAAQSIANSGTATPETNLGPKLWFRICISSNSALISDIVWCIRWPTKVLLSKAFASSQKTRSLSLVFIQHPHPILAGMLQLSLLFQNTLRLLDHKP